MPFPPQWGQGRASSLILAVSHPLAHPLRISRGKARHAGFGCCVRALPLCHGTCEGQGPEGSQAGCFRMPLLPGSSRVSFHPVEHGGQQPHQHHDLGPITAHVHTAVHPSAKWQSRKEDHHTHFQGRCSDSLKAEPSCLWSHLYFNHQLPTFQTPRSMRKSLKGKVYPK